MKNFRIFVLLAPLITSFVYAKSDAAKIGPIPTIQNASPALNKSLHALRMRIASDAQDCLGNAKGMEAVGEYNASIKEILDTSKIAVLEVSESMICDGIHSSSYQYGLAFHKITGKRFDLSQIYNIATRQDGHLFLRPELGSSARASYRQANKNSGACLDGTGWETELMNIPITFAPQPDGSVILYYAAPDASAACFPSLRLPPDAISEFRDGKQASQYELP
ncbi:hypothetical protein [Paraburkholderia heleia]|uniref:hypothetical protein n=1 Tax=Paraburkholderia heleia TaxID=634127 RepID=UPI000A02A042|nr:hypothetical protein [Paraburkholderia heleia]